MRLIILMASQSAFIPPPPPPPPDLPPFFPNFRSYNFPFFASHFAFRIYINANFHLPSSAGPTLPSLPLPSTRPPHSRNPVAGMQRGVQVPRIQGSIYWTFTGGPIISFAFFLPLCHSLETFSLLFFFFYSVFLAKKEEWKGMVSSWVGGRWLEVGGRQLCLIGPGGPFTLNLCAQVLSRPRKGS